MAYINHVLLWFDLGECGRVAFRGCCALLKFTSYIVLFFATANIYFEQH